MLKRRKFSSQKCNFPSEDPGRKGGKLSPSSRGRTQSRGERKEIERQNEKPEKKKTKS